jgi:uncharacterized protein (DUF2141 family)
MNITLAFASTTVLMLMSAVPVYAVDLSIRVTDVKSSEGKVGCTLYKNADGFPMNGSKGNQQWQIAAVKEVSFHYKGLPRGVYAVACSHDLNGNQITDTNFVGLPTEDWGVSNNIHPTFREPTFAEAKFDLMSNQSIEVRISQ